MSSISSRLKFLTKQANGSNNSEQTQLMETPSKRENLEIEVEEVKISDKIEVTSTDHIKTSNHSKSYSKLMAPS